MIDFEIKDIVPRFILNDKTGHALAVAIETALKIFLETAKGALEVWNDPEKMPEWRLDELAWEYGIVYDYDAEIAEKRIWIEEAVNFYRSMGTPAGVVKFLKAKLDTVKLEEWWEYGGDPYHFRIEAAGEWDQEIAAWTTATVNRVKNLRSVLDSLNVNSQTSDVALELAGNVGGVEVSATSICT